MTIYLITTSSRKFLKIGKTECYNVLNRIKNLQTGMPENLEIINVYMKVGGLDKTNYEKELHKLCKPYKINREWFELNEKSIKLLTDKLNYWLQENKIFKVGGFEDNGKEYFLKSIGIENL